MAERECEMNISGIIVSAFSLIWIFYSIYNRSELIKEFKIIFILITLVTLGLLYISFDNEYNYFNHISSYLLIGIIYTLWLPIIIVASNRRKKKLEWNRTKNYLELIKKENQNQRKFLFGYICVWIWIVISI